MLVTVLTPTYNRGYILGNLYQSLCDQDNHAFEWLIIDDGSTDNTEAMVGKWKKYKNGFNIVYLRKENGGKHRAINYAMGYIKTEYVFIVDSDDRLTKNAISHVIQWVETIDGDNSFAGVSGLRGFDPAIRNGGYPSGIPQGSYIDAGNRERRKFGLMGDKAEVYRTEWFRKCPFPEFEGEKFLSECIVYNAIADKGLKIRWFNEIIYIGEYRDDGLTNNLVSNRVACFRGFTEETKSEIRTRGMIRYRIIGRYIQVAKIKGLTIGAVRNLLNLSAYEIVMGCIWYRIQAAADVLRGRRQKRK